MDSVNTIPFPSEEALEDYICLKIDQTSLCPITGDGVQFYLRQPNLGDYGIPDVVKVNIHLKHVCITVMELKNTLFKAKNVSQVCRYMAGFKDYLSCKHPTIKEYTIKGEVVCPDGNQDNDVFLFNSMDDSISLHLFRCDIDNGFQVREAANSWSKTGAKFEVNLAKYSQVKEAAAHWDIPF